jgi:UDP-glucose:(glucosyl)LPS alpha-1,2-glucosyltransferase
MSKKVLMVSGPVHTNPPVKGAAVESWMYEVSQRLIGFEPHIVSVSHPFYPAKEYRDGIFFHRIHFSKLYKRLFQKITRLDPLSYPKRISQIIAEVKPDVVHMHNFTRWLDPLLENMCGGSPKTILHMHNESEAIPERGTDAFVGCSKFIVESFRGTSIKARNFSIIYNGVDTGRFRPYWDVGPLKDDIRSRFGIGKNKIVVLYLGRVSPEKGVEHFVQSALLLKNSENIQFYVVGELSKKGDRGAYADEIRRMAAPLGDRITFAGVFPPSKIHLLYLLGDIIILPSNFNEPFSMVGIEAMATGLPVIAARKGGLTEYIVDGHNGLFIDADRKSTRLNSSHPDCVSPSRMPSSA